MLGLVAVVREDYPRSQQLLQEARFLAIDGVKAGWSELGLAMLACGRDDFASAREHLQKMLAQQPVLGSYYIAPCFLVMALILMDEGDVVSGIEIISLTLHHPEIAIMARLSEEWPLVSRIQTRVKANLGENVYATAWERGKLLSFDNVVQSLLDQFSAPQGASEELISDQKQIANQTLITPLTQREHEILILIAQGLSNRQVAERLFIEVSTVKRHVNNCYGKLQVTSRTQAIIKAQHLNLV